MGKSGANGLTYDKSLPPFLARLQGQYAAGNSGPDPILAAQRRAAKKRSASEEAEDAPLVLDDRGEAVAVTIGKDGTVEDSREDNREAGEKGGKEETREPRSAVNAVAGIGAGKKKKVGRVIGGEDRDENDGEDGRWKRKRVVEEDAKDATGKRTDASTAASGSQDKNKKKKKKKIQLSFEDDEDEGGRG